MAEAEPLKKKGTRSRPASTVSDQPSVQSSLSTQQLPFAVDQSETSTLDTTGTDEKHRASPVGAATRESTDMSSPKAAASKTKSTYPREFSSVSPMDSSVDIEDEDFKYEPPAKNDTLPDLYRLLEALEVGDSELDSERQPPSLFKRPEYVPKYQKISELRQELERSELQQYLQEFEEGVQDDVVMLGMLSLDEVQEEERRLRDEHVQYLDQEVVRTRTQQEELLQREELAKKRVAQALKDRRSEIAKKEAILKQKEKLLLDRLHRAFRRAESHLIETLESRKGEVKVFYGDLMLADGRYGGSRGRRWKVDWNRTPQPIQVKVKCLRGVKDKLPGGRYVLMVSLYNRLGGHVLRWSKLKGQQWGGATLPIRHDGNFYNIEMKVDQSMFTVLPSKPSMRPGMVLVFELFLLRGSVVPTDRVVGWGCFPICDGQFDVIEGKYKCPFLRGEMDPAIDRHEKIEELMASDLDHWLCNLYLEIVKLPRFLAGQKEYEVELQFSAGLTGHPDRIKTGGEEARDGEQPVQGSAMDVDSEPSQSASNASLNSVVPSNSEFGTRSDAAASKVKLSEKDFMSDIKSGIALDLKGSEKGTTTIIGSRHLIHKEKKVDLSVGESSGDSDSEIEESFAVKKGEELKPVKGMPGLHYKRYMNNPVDVYQKKLYSMLPKTALLAPKKKKRKMTHLEELEQHTMSVQPPFAGKGRLARKGNEKLEYVGRQFLAELGLSQWRSREFWGMLLLLIVVFFIRMFMHYIGQWLFLTAIEIPINKFNFLPYTVELNYQATLLHTREEIAVVVLGPLLNVVIFTLMVIFSWVCQKIFGLFPDLFCKFVMAYGIMTFLNPLLILIVDCALLRYEFTSVDPIADFAKLWWHFYRIEGSGLAGIFITVFLYCFVGFMSASILYMYFLRLHNNGRMLDTFWRLHGSEDKFFVPHDLEISNPELSYIVRKAEQWRGEEGERRKVAVYDYIWEEDIVEESVWDENDMGDHSRVDQDGGRREITTHVSIHMLHLDGLRELYRHFLRMPDGAVVEVFGDMTVPGMDKDVKLALEKGAQGIERLMGSDTSLNKVRGRQTAWTDSGLKPEEKGGAHPSPSSSSRSSPTFMEKKKML